MKSFFKKTVVLILRMEAQAVLKKYRPRIVAITGSVGKTSTKDAVFAMLSKSEHVRGSDKSFNSELGIPLTILGCPNAWNNPLGWIQNILDGLFLIVFPTSYPRWLVLEVGADRPGDISSLASWLAVDVAVITRLPDVPVHVEYFDSPEAVVQEKASLIDALKPDGVLIAYADDARTGILLSKAEKRSLHTIRFGFTKEAEVRGTQVKLLHTKKERWPTGISAHISTKQEAIPTFVMGVIGSHALLPIIAAAAVGIALGKNLTEIAPTLERYTPPPGRMRLLPGLKGSLVIDDTYNSSPAAVSAALDSLAAIKAPCRKIAVLGDMLELGRMSVDEHRKVGAHAAQTADLLLTVGFRARDIAEGALSAGFPESNILQYEDAERAGEELQATVEERDCILVKGSQSMRMERVVERLIEEPERAHELLVRQEKNWKRR